MIDVTCALIEQEGKVLATQRSATMDLPFQWEFPGGKRTPGENINDCIRREILEELQLKVEPVHQLPSTIHDYGSRVIRLIPLVCRIVGGQLHLVEHQAYRWVSPAGLRELDWCLADVPVAEAYLAWINSNTASP